MKLFSYETAGKDRVGIVAANQHYDINESANNVGLNLPCTMNGILANWEQYSLLVSNLEKAITKSATDFIPLKIERLLSPVPFPTSCRDGYAFRQHVETARRNRGASMIPEFDHFPIFYFTNHNAIFGEGEIFVEEDHLQKLDFELECAVVIGKEGKNIDASVADSFIAGYMIMNDLSARTLQMEEMLLNLGPAKGKDFATTLGPYLVTVDELEDKKIATPFGNKYDLGMRAYHNGRQISLGNVKDMNWTFAEIIERASYGVTLHPGDVIGSGTVGTGCYLELNGTLALEAKARNETFTPTWLQNGDTIELQIDKLGSLKNTIRKSGDSYSILKKKKNQS